MDETILNIPLGPLRPLISTRIWNLLTRSGFSTIAQLRKAQDEGLRPGDIKGLGSAALLEIRLALDSLPADAERPREAPAGTAPAPSALTGRELLVILGLAEAGMSERAWAWHGSHPGYPAGDQAEALNAVRRLHLLVHGTPRPDGVPDPLDDPREGGDPVVFGGTLTQPPDPPPPPGRPGPEPVDDEFAGYEMDARTGRSSQDDWR
jgi:hypothetical protein